jgi:hypothetical protein
MATQAVPEPPGSGQPPLAMTAKVPGPGNFVNATADTGRSAINATVDTRFGGG